MIRTAVVTINYNNASDTALCIDSLKNSETPCEIIVVDNASDIKDVEKLSLIQGIILIQNMENVGFGRGNNIGIRWAIKNTNCEFIFLLNNDAQVEIDTIRILEASLDDNPDTGIAAPCIVLTENPDVMWYGGGDFWWPKGGPRTPGYLRCGAEGVSCALQERNVTFASGCAMLIRRSVIETVGGFDPRYFMYDEDAELCLRVLNAGMKIRYIPKALVLHDCQGSQRKKDVPLFPFLHPNNPGLTFNIYHTTKNRLITAKKHARGWNVVLFSFGFPMLLISKCLRYACHRKWDAIYATGRGFIDFLRTRNSIFVDELRLKGDFIEEGGGTSIINGKKIS